MGSIEDLAVFGGKPLFSQPLHVGRPNVPAPEKVLARIQTALANAWLTNDGPLVRELEQKLSAYLEVEHCVAMSNGTAAMEVLVRALELRGEVIVPAYTFVATAHAFAWLGVDPVFCDIDPLTHTIDVQAAERLITSRTSAIVGVHLWGRACNVRELDEMAARQGIPVIYDAAHALGATVDHRKVGNFGKAEVFSFHATKFFNTFEGGAITTHDDDLASKLRLLRNFGFAGYDDVVSLGTNAKMSEAHAAMGLGSIEAIDELVELNRRTWTQYAECLGGIPGLALKAAPIEETSNFQYVVFEVNEAAPLSRDQLLQVLWHENIRARRYFFPGCHRMPPYVHRQHVALPNTEAAAARVLVLPAGATVTADQVSAVADMIKFALQHAAELRLRLPEYLPPGAFKA